jgi:hypothetical protein
MVGWLKKVRNLKSLSHCRQYNISQANAAIPHHQYQQFSIWAGAKIKQRPFPDFSP